MGKLRGRARSRGGLRGCIVGDLPYRLRMRPFCSAGGHRAAGKTGCRLGDGITTCRYNHKMRPSATFNSRKVLQRRGLGTAFKNPLAYGMIPASMSHDDVNPGAQTNAMLRQLITRADKAVIRTTGPLVIRLEPG